MSTGLTVGVLAASPHQPFMKPEKFHDMATGAFYATTAIEGWKAIREPAKHGPFAIGWVLGDIAGLGIAKAFDIGESH